MATRKKKTARRKAARPTTATARKTAKAAKKAVKKAVSRAVSGVKKLVKRGKEMRAARTARLRPRRQPESLRVRAISVGLTVSDVGASMAWYRDVLGCVVLETWNTDGQLMGAMMRTGAATIVLGQDDWKKGRDRVKGEGLRLYFTTVQDVDHMAKQIRARGGRLATEPQDQSWGVRDFSLLDPDGFRITVQSDR